jgi:toxin YoeB
MRNAAFTPIALRHITEWANHDRAIFNKIMRLVEETCQSPFKGIGKPEALKHEYQGCWSRRITEEHRLIYRVTPDAIVIIACKAHYK